MSPILATFIFAYTAAIIAMTASTILTQGMNNPDYPMSRVIKESILWPITFAHDIYQLVTAIKNLEKDDDEK